LDAEGNIKVCDFGLARIQVSTITMTKVGTPRWVAPEVLKDERYSEKADVYSYGVILWEVATGEIPYGEGTPAMKVIMTVAFQQKLLQVPANTPAPYKNLIGDCLVESPERRPSFPEIENILAGIMIGQE